MTRGRSRKSSGFVPCKRMASGGKAGSLSECSRALGIKLRSFWQWFRTSSVSREPPAVPRELLGMAATLRHGQVAKGGTCASNVALTTLRGSQSRNPFLGPTCLQERSLISRNGYSTCPGLYFFRRSFFLCPLQHEVGAGLLLLGLLFVNGKPRPLFLMVWVSFV